MTTDSASSLDHLIKQLSAIRLEMLELEATTLAEQSELHESHRESAKNLLHYLALRRHDLRHIQDSLAAQGLSSLGRAESHVRANVDSIERVVRRLVATDNGDSWPANDALSYEEGLSLLDSHTAMLLGPKPAHRMVRIMVTMPSEAAHDYHFVHKLVLDGMDCMRINCAYDDVSAWQKMIEHAKKAAKETGRSCRILMDVAGPKLRTGPIEPGPEVVKWRPRRNVYGNVLSPAKIWLAADEKVAPPAAADTVVPIKGQWSDELRAGDILKFFDARGSARWMKATKAGDGGWWAESNQTTYIASGTLLHLCRPGKPIKAFPGCVGKLPATEQYILLKPGHKLILTKSMIPGKPAVFDDNAELTASPQIAVTLPAIFDDVQPGERIWFDDGAIGGLIKAVRSDELEIEITHARPTGSKLRADKGINLPDSKLRLPALTDKDLEDLRFIARHADLVGYSFVRSAADVHELQKQLVALGGQDLGIILKIETRRAFEELPNLLLAVMRSPSAGVMIARGDLAVECGWERMAEVQEEILWICEAAHMPVIWATQVLESLAKQGLPSRAEITDAAMGERAECVMLNKGQYILEAVRVLDDILRRMENHQSKKRSMLRHLRLADHFSLESVRSATK
jgi:pyruvate kinase